MPSTWGWKLSTDPDDVMNFLNGKGAYKHPVKDFRVGGTWRGTYTEFYIFYKSYRSLRPTSGWGWKKSTDPDDVMNFLNGKGAYKDPVKDARVTVMWRDTYEEFYIFYK